MVNRLVLVRHGDAEFFGPEGTDESRRLTARGLAALQRSYPRTFACLAGRDDVHVWVSPAVRALQTAEVAAGVLGIDPSDFDVHVSLYDQDDDEFLAELEAEGEGCVVAVGHVPFMHRMVRELTGESVPFEKGSVACVEFDEDGRERPKLLWFVPGPEV